MRARPPMLLLVLIALITTAVACHADGEFVEIDHLRLDGRERSLPLQLGRDELADDQTYVLGASVELPPALRGEAVDLSIPLFQAQVALIADGAVASAIEGGGSAYREAGPQRWRIPAAATADGQLELELHVEHRWTQSGWLNTRPRVLAAGAPDPRARRVRVVNIWGSLLGIGGLVQVGLSCLLVYALDRRRFAYLWFGVQALTAATYPAYLAGVLAGVVGPWEGVIVELGLVAALATSLLFCHRMFELGPVPRWMLALLGGAALLSLAMTGPYLATPVAARAVVISVVVATVYQIWVLVRLLRSEPSSRGSVAWYLCAWLVLALGTWVDLAAWFGFGELLGGVRPAGASLCLFALALSLLFSRRHILSLESAAGLNAELGQRLDELEAERELIASLNQSLRMQIADRSAQLFSALSLVGGGDRRQVTLAAGAEIDGSYRVERALGAGAMGMVYEVTRISDQTRWALKVATGLDGRDLARLAREAHIASKIEHPNVVEIRDISVATMGFLFIVLELVDGESLRARLEREELGVEEALPILVQVARGLVALHELGIAHRDLKPDNVLLDPELEPPRAKITDFGISRLGGSTGFSVISVAESVELEAEAEPASSGEAGEPGEGAEGESPEPSASANADLATVVEPIDTSTSASASASRSLRGSHSSLDLTGTGMLAGTPHYVAPELALGGPVDDVRGDLFSFGVLAYETLAGRRPFAIPVAMSLRSKEPPCARRPLRLDAKHAALEELILRCLQFEPERRPTAAELVAELERLSAEAGLSQ